MKVSLIIVLMINAFNDVEARTSQDFLVFRVQKGMFMMDLQGGRYIHPQMSHFPGELPLALDPLVNRLFVRCCGSTVSSYDIQNETLSSIKHDSPHREPHAPPLIKDGDIDYLNGLLFVTDFKREKIIAFSSDLNKEWTIISDTRSPYAIAVDPISRLLFWSSSYYKTIQRSYLDGRHQKVIIRHDLGKVVAMTVDVQERRLFWADLDLERIESSDLGGQGRRVVLTARGHQIRGLAIDEECVYYTSYITNNVFKANKDDGSGVAKLGDIGSESYDDRLQVDGMVIRKESLIIRGNSSCHPNNGGCPYLCIPTLDGHSCAGPQGVYTVSPQLTSSTTQSTTSATTLITRMTTTTTTQPMTTPSTHIPTTATTIASSTTLSSTRTKSSAYPTTSEASSKSINATSKSPSTTTSSTSATSVTSEDSDADFDANPTAGVIDSTRQNPSWKIVAGVLIILGGVIAAGVLIWFFMFKRRGEKETKMVENPSYSTRGQHHPAAAVAPYVEAENDLYSEISHYNDIADKDHKYCYVEDKNKYYNEGINGYNSNQPNLDILEAERDDIAKKPNDGYEVPVPSVYADMRPKSQVPLLLADESSNVEENSPIYEKFDGIIPFSQKDDACASDTYALGPPIAREPTKELAEHNYMNTVNKSQMNDLEMGSKVRHSDALYDTYEVPMPHEYRNVLLLGTLKKDTNI